MAENSTESTRGGPAQLHLGSTVVASFEELDEAVHGWEFDWTQLDRGLLRASAEYVGAPSLELNRFQFSRRFHQRGTSPLAARTFGLLESGSTPVEWAGGTAKAEQLIAFPVGDEYQFVSHPGFCGEAVSVSEERLQATAAMLGLPDPMESAPTGQAFLEASPRQMAALRSSCARLRAVAAVHRATPIHRNAWAGVELELLTCLVTVLASGAATPRPEAPANRARAVRVALDYIRDNADGPPTVAEICRVSGSSSRTLNYAFHDQFGVAPKQYLQAVRLSRVRNDLGRGDGRAAVADVAGRWGFWHMGQFAADYRRMFGELPSRTLQRRMLAAHG